MNIKDYKEPYTEEGKYAEHYRQEQLDDLNLFLKTEQEKLEKERKANVTPEKFYKNIDESRQKFISFLGFPYSKKDEIPYGNDVISEVVKTEGNITWYRLKIEIMPNFSIYGILAKHNDDKVRPFVLAQSGMLGTPEILNGWIFNSSNYNHIIRRLLEYDVNVFSMQAYLWADETYGAKYDRLDFDSKLRMLGGSITALEMFMFNRTVDYFEKQNYVDKNRIGMVGLSYGGMHTLYYSALDTRIKSAYSSCFFNDRTKWIRPDWAYFGFEKYFNDAEVGALVAPRALFIEVGNIDQTCVCTPAIEQAERLKEFYGYLNKQDKFKFNVHPLSHEFSQTDEGIEFFFKNL